MTNHVHLLIERQAHKVGKIMHRVLTGYSQYYNRRYRRVGHLLQGRHKAVLCQSVSIPGGAGTLYSSQPGARPRGD